MKTFKDTIFNSIKMSSNQQEIEKKSTAQERKAQNNELEDSKGSVLKLIYRFTGILIDFVGGI